MKPGNLRRIDDGSERSVLEAQLAQVVQQLKTAEDTGEDKTLYQKMLAELVRKLKEIDLAAEARAKQRAAAASREAVGFSCFRGLGAAAKAKVERSKATGAWKWPSKVAALGDEGLRPPPLPRERSFIKASDPIGSGYSLLWL